jgi:hypothetical protein
MKQISLSRLATFLLVVVSGSFFISSCKKENQSTSKENSNATMLNAQAKMNDEDGAPLTLELQHFTMHYEDANGNMPTGDATPLYSKNGGQHIPIMTPDGQHQVTLGEYNMISGTASIKCINAGTHVVMHLKGLIPNGVYTIWTVVYQAPGFNGVSIPVNRIGFGALGEIEGDRNSNAFTADADGNASISVIRPAGHLGSDGSVNPHPNYMVPNCLGDTYETHLALAYHLNNIPAAPGPPTTWVVQGFFRFFGSQL